MGVVVSTPVIVAGLWLGYYYMITDSLPFMSLVDRVLTPEKPQRPTLPRPTRPSRPPQQQDPPVVITDGNGNEGHCAGDICWEGPDSVGDVSLPPPYFNENNERTAAYCDREKGRCYEGPVPEGKVACRENWKSGQQEGYRCYRAPGEECPSGYDPAQCDRSWGMGSNIGGGEDKVWLQPL